MNNKKRFLPILLFFLTSCGGNGVSLTREDVLISNPISSITEDMISDSFQERISSSALSVKASSIEEKDYKKIPSYLLARLNELKTYKCVTSGKTTTQALFLKIEQQIDVTVLKSDISYMMNSSHSNVYSSKHEAYYKGEKVYYHDSNAEFKLSTLSEYLSVYGTYPFDYAIEGYSIKEDAILSVSKVETNENYSFKFVFDPEKATNNVRIQMKAFGQLDDFPIFSSAEIILTVKEDFTPVKYELSSTYKAKKVIETDCKQNYNVTFSDFNQPVEIPKLEEMKEIL